MKKQVHYNIPVLLLLLAATGTILIILKYLRKRRGR